MHNPFVGLRSLLRATPLRRRCTVTTSIFLAAITDAVLIKAYEETGLIITWPYLMLAHSNYAGHALYIAGH